MGMAHRDAGFVEGEWVCISNSMEVTRVSVDPANA